VGVCVIPEQRLEQVCHDVHAVAAQSTGQNCVEHGEDSEVSPQSCPPFIGCCITLRVRTAAPAPHETEHELQPLQADTEQSTGHSAEAHCPAVSRVVGQAWPPACAATTISLALVVVPWPPQLAEHSRQLVHVEATQLFGQSCRVQCLKRTPRSPCSGSSRITEPEGCNP
jgi:hypothetical protein